VYENPVEWEFGAFCTHATAFGSFPVGLHHCVHTVSPSVRTASGPCGLRFGGVDLGDVLPNLFLFLESNRPMDQSYAKSWVPLRVVVIVSRDALRSVSLCLLSVFLFFAYFLASDKSR
jgi:hypothetical protein